MALFALAKMIASDVDVLLFWLCIAKYIIWLPCFVYFWTIQKRVLNYDQLFEYIPDSILMGTIFGFLYFVLDCLCQDIKKLQRKTKQMVTAATLSEKLERGYHLLLEENQKQLQSLRTELSQVESKLETKTKDANAAEANITVLRNAFRELHNELDIVVEANRSLQKQLQSPGIKLKYEPETEAKDVYTAEAKVIARGKQAEVILLEYDRLLGEQEDELHSCRTRINDLDFELETKAIEGNAAEANIIFLSNKCGQLLNEQGLAVVENQSLKNQLQSSEAKLKQLEYELETAEANVIALKKQSEEIFLDYDRLLEEKVNQLQLLRTRVNNLEFELETKEKDVNAAEANIIVLRNLCGDLQTEQGLVVEENRSLKRQLQSSVPILKQLESQFKTTIKDIDVVEATVNALQEKIDHIALKYDRLLEENKILKSQLERESGWEIVRETDSQEGSDEDSIGSDDASHASFFTPDCFEYFSQIE